MDHNLQIWLVVVSLALILSVAMQIFLIGILVRLMMVLRPKPGQPGLWEITDRALEAIEALDRATRTTLEILDQVKPVVDEASSALRRQISHADEVLEEVLTGVGRMNRAVNTVMTWPFRETRALSAGLRSVATTLFKINGNASKEKQW